MGYKMITASVSRTSSIKPTSLAPRNGNWSAWSGFPVRLAGEDSLRDSKRINHLDRYDAAHYTLDSLGSPL